MQKRLSYHDIYLAFAVEEDSAIPKEVIPPEEGGNHSPKTCLP